MLNIHLLDQLQQLCCANAQAFKIGKNKSINICIDSICSDCCNAKRDEKHSIDSRIGGDLVYRKVAAKNRLFACGPTDATAIPIMSGLASF